MIDFYVILGVSPSASTAEIKTAYRRLVVRWHPDVSVEPDCHERFSQISEAHSTLSSPSARASYDICRQGPTWDAYASPSAPREDPLAEILRRHRASAQQRAAYGHDSDWKYRQAHWEREKAEAGEYKERSKRVQARVHQAHTGRIVRALRTQWPTHAAVGRHDLLATGVFVSGLTAVAWYWSGASKITDVEGHKPETAPVGVT